MKAETTYSAIVGRVIAVRRRGRNGASQEEMAEKAGINRSSWSRIESGDMAPDVFQLSRIAKVLGCSSEEIVKEADEKKTSLEEKGITVRMWQIRYEDNRPVAMPDTPALYAVADADDILGLHDASDFRQQRQAGRFRPVQPVALLDVAALEGLMYDDHINKGDKPEAE